MSMALGMGMDMAHARSAPWRLSQIPGLFAGWDFSRLNLAADATIASVPPEAGSIALTQSTEANKPVFKPGGINGVGAAYFTTNDFLNGVGVAANVSGNDVAFTAFGVVQADNLGALQTLVGFNANPINARHLLQKNAGNNAQIARRGTGEGADTTVTGTAPGTAAFAYIQVFTGTTVTLYTGTAQTKLIDGAALNTGSATLGIFKVGCQHGDLNFMTGHWGTLGFALGEASATTRDWFMRGAAARFGTA